MTAHPDIPETFHVETECLCGQVAKWRIAFTVPGARQSHVVYACDEGKALLTAKLASRTISTTKVRL